MGLDRIVANAPKRSPSPEPQPRDVWKQVTFRGVRQYQDARAPVENYQLSLPCLNLDLQFIKGYLFSSSQALASAGSSGSSTPLSGFAGPSSGLAYRPSSYETMQVPYAFNRAQSRHPEETAQTDVSTVHAHTMEHVIANPSPFAQGPLTTRFSSFPYRNFSPSHFIDNSSPSFSGVQSTYAQNNTPGAHPAEPLVVTTSVNNSSTAFDTVFPSVPAPHAPLQTTEDLVAYLEHRTRLAQQQ